MLRTNEKKKLDTRVQGSSCKAKMIDNKNIKCLELMFDNHHPTLTKQIPQKLKCI